MLFEACHSGSELERVAAFERLGQLLYRLLLPRVRRDPRLQHLAQDCAQDAMVKIWRKLDEGQGPEDPDRFIAWSGRIATNALLDALRRLEPAAKVQRSKRVALSRQVRMDAELEAGDRPMADRLADEGAVVPDERLAYAEIHALLARIRDIQSISEQSRTVLTKGFLEGWEDEELAKYLDTSRRNVHVIRCRDLVKLRADADFMAELQTHYPSRGEA
jgi:RNA polymerase sigma factor (sigma-70 family)